MPHHRKAISTPKSRTRYLKPIGKHIMKYRRRTSVMVGLVCVIVVCVYIVIVNTSILLNSPTGIRSMYDGHRVILHVGPSVHERLGKFFNNILVGIGAKSNESNTVVKTILLWTPFFGKHDYASTSNCRSHVKCVVTSNRSSLSESDAIIFHLADTNVDDLPKTRREDQRWVLLYHESPNNTPHKALVRLEGLINWTITYRRESDVVLSPRTIPVKKPLPPGMLPNYNWNKTRMIAWLVSNCHTASRRELFVERLRRTVSVDIYGKCGQLTCLPKMSRKCLNQLSREYRFYLSFENSICKDYVTEKFFDVLQTSMVPVVFGGADYKYWAPPQSYINALDFDSPRQLGKYLLSVAMNDTKYNEFFQWKRSFKVGVGDSYACSLCKKLHDRTEPRSIYKNLERWWFGEANCRRWTPTDE